MRKKRNRYNVRALILPGWWPILNEFSSMMHKHPDYRSYRFTLTMWCFVSSNYVCIVHSIRFFVDIRTRWTKNEKHFSIRNIAISILCFNIQTEEEKKTNITLVSQHSIRNQIKWNSFAFLINTHWCLDNRI